MVRQDAPRGGGTSLDAPLKWEAVAAAVRAGRPDRRVVYLPTTGSTNDDAKRLALLGEPDGTLVLADEQTAGRGRAGKARWLTPARTSIAVSVILRPTLRAERLSVLAMVAGLAAVDGIRRGAAVEATLKWPNDVLAGERKLGGILVESALSGAGVGYAVVGIGLNGNLRAEQLGQLPDAAVAPTTLLDAAGRRVEREAVVVALVEALDAHYAAVESGALGAVTRAFRQALGTLGQTVRLSAAGHTVEGVAEDVTEAGALVVRLKDGTRREFAYGEVSVRAAGRREPR